MRKVTYTEALECLANGGTVRRVLPDGHTPICYFAPIRLEWQPAITGLGMTRGRTWFAEIVPSFADHKKEARLAYTMSDEARAGEWEILCERGTLRGEPSDWVINQYESYARWQARNYEAMAKLPAQSEEE